MVRLKIAEAFTEGRGDAHGCAARATLQGRFIRPSPVSLENAEDKIAGSNFGQRRAGPEGVSPRDGRTIREATIFLPGARSPVAAVSYPGTFTGIVVTE
jgi:hypothetical protein